MVPVILCGGGGVRLWPLSRQMVPKPFVELPAGGTLLGGLLESLRDWDSPCVIYAAAAGQVAACQAAHVAAGLACPAIVLAEPAARNTAPAIAAATWHAGRELDPATVLAILPADHMVADRIRYNAALALAGQAATAGKLATLGIAPTRPATEFGYIKALDDPSSAWQTVGEFTEKPDLERAGQMLAAGQHYWNAGVFVATVATFIEEFERHAPLVAAVACRLDLGIDAAGVCALAAAAYAEFPSISFDYAVAEKTGRAVVVPVTEAGWSDVGTWDGFRELLPATDHGNRQSGEVLLVDSKGVSVMAAADRLVTVVGCTDINVVDTPDALLVAGRGTAAAMREVQQRLATDDRLIYPVAERRPWGRYRQLGAGQGWKAKRIEVDPGGRLSLQSHEHRAEHWVVVEGVMTVTIGTEQRVLQAGEACHIPVGTRHRLANETKKPAVLVEVQSGAYLGEDDIQRYEDDFGRS